MSLFNYRVSASVIGVAMVLVAPVAIAQVKSATEIDAIAPFPITHRLNASALGNENRVLRSRRLLVVLLGRYVVEL